MNAAPDAKKDLPVLDNLGDFLLNSPLYKSYRVPPQSDSHHLSSLTGREWGGARVNRFDGYCPFCRRETTYKVFRSFPMNDADYGRAEYLTWHERMVLQCGRIDDHHLTLFLRLSRMVLQKIGQYPSLADIAQDELRSKYRTVLKGSNASELYKAVGLAAHGEGIASFVYLRRVLERLVQSRFDDFKAAEGWKEDEFDRLRMPEKMAFLAKHLPEFMVKNRRIYSIFSLGIHELDNARCLNFFEVGKQSIVFILQEDLRKKEEADARKLVEAAVAKFDHTGNAE